MRYIPLDNEAKTTTPMGAGPTSYPQATLPPLLERVMEGEFKSAFERSKQLLLENVCFDDFVAAYGTANMVKLHEIYIAGEMPVDDETLFSGKFFQSDLAAAIITRDAVSNRDK